MTNTASRPHPARHAFTLIELSIVLVIVGLLAGSSVVGENLIHASELRAVGAEFRNYQAAMGSFKEKYGFLPGDIPNATSLWGAREGGLEVGVVTDCVQADMTSNTPPADPRATCNGDGNGIIDLSDGAISTGVGGYEGFRAWQHLSNAGFIVGNYTGMYAGPYNNLSFGTNAPKSRIQNAGWAFLGFYDKKNNVHLWTNADTNMFVDTEYGNTLTFGTVNADWLMSYAPFNAGGYSANGPIIKAEDAYNIDKKLDDGFPHTGTILTYKHNYHPHCADSTNTKYMVSDTTLGCSLIFLTGH